MGNHLGPSEHIRIGQIEQGQNTSEQGHQNTRTPLEHQNTTRTPEPHQNTRTPPELVFCLVVVFWCSCVLPPEPPEHQNTSRTLEHHQNTRTPEVQITRSPEHQKYRTPELQNTRTPPEHQNTRSPEHHPKARKPPEHQNSTRTRSSSCYAGPHTSDLALRPSGGSQGNFPDRGPVWGTRPRQPLLWWEGVQTSERLNYVEKLRWAREEIKRGHLGQMRRFKWVIF